MVEIHGDCICVYAVLVCVYGVFLVLSIGLIAGIISRGIGIVKSTLFGRINKQHRCIAMQTSKFCRSMPKPLKERV